jgi:hypothetical protein
VPYQVSVEHDARTIAVRGYGKGTTADTLELIAGVQDTLRDCPGYNFLYDSRELDIASSAQDMMKVAEALFGSRRVDFGRFAIVVPESRIGLARIFTALAYPFGIHANVFGDMRDAREWLGGTDQPRGRA